MRYLHQDTEMGVLRKILRSLVGCILISGCYCTVLAQSFDHLSILQIKGYFTYTIRFDSTLTEVLNERIDKEYGGNLAVKAILARLSNASKEKYFVVFCEGMSVDPFFEIHRINENQEIDASFKIHAIINEEKRTIGGISGLELVIPGNGSVYVSGHTNNMFNMRRKFSLKDGNLEEIKQPFYYVGLESVVTEDIKIYADIEQTKAIANLPKGSAVTVLINKGDCYLLKTPFGLVGWLKIPEALQTSIKGLFFNGD